MLPRHGGRRAIHGHGVRGAVGKVLGRIWGEDQESGPRPPEGALEGRGDGEEGGFDGVGNPTQLNHGFGELDADLPAFLQLGRLARGPCGDHLKCTRNRRHQGRRKRHEDTKDKKPFHSPPHHGVTSWDLAEAHKTSILGNSFSVSPTRAALKRGLNLLQRTGGRAGRSASP